MIGEALGNYKVTATLGSGTMGVVFRADHVRIARTAAIKVLLPELAQNARLVQRFFNEARATSLIRHPGIVEVFDCDVDDSGRAYIVMEHLDGETLAERLRRTRSIPWAAACEIARQVAAAIAAAHDIGIVHRDLKPENVFLVRNGNDPELVASVKVLDFGIAKLLASDASVRLTMRGMVLGTPEYMAPEQCSSAEEIDGGTDIYALGCIVFEMLSGAPPFIAESVQELFAAHMLQPAPPIADRVPGLPAWLVDLVTRMLAKRRTERPRAMHDVVRELTDGTKTPPRALGIEDESRAEPAAAGAAGRRRERAMLVIAGACALAAGALAWRSVRLSLVAPSPMPPKAAVLPGLEQIVRAPAAASPAARAAPLPPALAPAVAAPASATVARSVRAAERPVPARPKRTMRLRVPRGSGAQHVVDTDGIVDL
jgi:serine/threonine-protein kinase